MRYLRRALSILSLFLLLLAVVVWLRSYSVTDEAGWDSQRWTNTTLTRARFSFAADQGLFQFTFIRDVAPVAHAQLDINLFKIRIAPDGQLIAGEPVVERHNSPPDQAGFFVHSAAVFKQPISQLLLQSLVGFTFSHPSPQTTGGKGSIPAWLIIVLIAILPLRQLKIRRCKRLPPPSEHTVIPAIL